MPIFYIHENDEELQDPQTVSSEEQHEEHEEKLLDPHEYPVEFAKIGYCDRVIRKHRAYLLGFLNRFCKHYGEQYVNQQEHPLTDFKPKEEDGVPTQAKYKLFKWCSCKEYAARENKDYPAEQVATNIGKMLQPHLADLVNAYLKAAKIPAEAKVEVVDNCKENGYKAVCYIVFNLDDIPNDEVENEAGIIYKGKIFLV